MAECQNYEKKVKTNRLFSSSKQHPILNFAIDLAGIKGVVGTCGTSFLDEHGVIADIVAGKANIEGDAGKVCCRTLSVTSKLGWKT